jgi:hypothetical protein
MGSGTNTARGEERMDGSPCAVAAMNNKAGSGIDMGKLEATADL